MKIDRDKPLPEHTRVDYYECYAKVILEDLFPERYVNLCVSDKPDLQNIEKNIGVEVTSAVPAEQREAVKLWYTMPYVSEEKQKSNKERMEQLGVEYQGDIQAWPAKVYSHSEIDGYPIEDFIKAVQNKITKLNKGNYKEFSRYDLFVYSEIYVNKTLIPKVLERLNIINNVRKHFSYIYLLAQDKFICFDTTAGNFNIVYIEDKQFTYAVKAREMVIQEEENE